MVAGAVAVQFSALGLVLFQAVLCVVIARRLVLVSRCEGRSTLSTKALACHRGLIIAACGLQLVRLVDPFTAWSIWPNTFCVVLQVTVSTMIFYQLTTLSFIMIDTLYACAMKPTPRFFLHVALVLPIAQTLLSIAATSVKAMPGVNAMNAFSGSLLVLLNMSVYNALGCYLVWMLKSHTADHTISHEEPSANSLRLVITRTFKSMAFLTVVSSIAFGLLFHSALTTARSSSDRPFTVLSPEALFIQIAAEFMFTKLSWLSASQVKDRQQQSNHSKPQNSAPTSTSAADLPQTRASRCATKSELMNRAKTLSQVNSSTTTASLGSAPDSLEPSSEQTTTLDMSEGVALEIIPTGSPTIVEHKPPSSSYIELS